MEMQTEVNLSNRLHCHSVFCDFSCFFIAYVCETGALPKCVTHHSLTYLLTHVHTTHDARTDDTSTIHDLWRTNRDLLRVMLNWLQTGKTYRLNINCVAGRSAFPSPVKWHWSNECRDFFALDFQVFSIQLNGIFFLACLFWSSGQKCNQHSCKELYWQQTANG